MSETILKIDNSMPHAATIAKCWTAVERGELGNLTKSDFNTALDAVADAVAERDNVPRANAYLAVLESPIGSALYRGYLAAPAAPTLAKGASRREPPCSQPQKELDRLAHQLADAAKIRQSIFRKLIGLATVGNLFRPARQRFIDGLGISQVVDMAGEASCLVPVDAVRGANF